MARCRDTFIYCRPGVLDTTGGELDVDLVLLRLARELGLPDEPLREEYDNSIVIPGIGPAEVWCAMDRISTYWTQRELFVLPRSHRIGARYSPRLPGGDPPR